MQKIALPLLVIMLLAATATPLILVIPGALAQTEGETAAVVVSQFYDVTADQVNTSVLVQINVTNVIGMQGYVMNMSWDPTMLSVTEVPKEFGVRPLYPSSGTTYYGLSRGSLLNTTLSNFGVRNVNNTLGTIWYLWQMRPTGGMSGDGVLATINFTILKLGTTKIELSSPANAAFEKDPNYAPAKSRLQNANDMSLIPHEDIDGVISDQPPPVQPIWSQLWFLASVAVVAIVAVPTLAIVAYSKTHKPEKDKIDWDKYEEDEV